MPTKKARGHKSDFTGELKAFLETYTDQYDPNNCKENGALWCKMAMAAVGEFSWSKIDCVNIPGMEKDKTIEDIPLEERDTVETARAKGMHLLVKVR